MFMGIRHPIPFGMQDWNGIEWNAPKWNGIEQNLEAIVNIIFLFSDDWE